MRPAVPHLIEIELRISDDVLHLKIHDDGLGFNADEACLRAVEGVSLGIISMQERAILAKGKPKSFQLLGLGRRFMRGFR